MCEDGSLQKISYRNTVNAGCQQSHLEEDGRNMHCPHPRVGVGVLVVRGNQLLLGKRIGKHMPGYYAAPGGHLEPGESFAKCAEREVMEETGLSAEQVRFLCLGHYQFGEQFYVDVDMVAVCPEGTPRTREPDKCAGWDWYEIDNLPSPLFVVTERMISAYMSGVSIHPDSLEAIIKQQS